ncbi:hypothetical protein NDU88_003488 [Pleurodeles waltl]|uniref:Uncharacterized protein n=1 Tax=Pleurodeles waltl TaxID=8319 RepID=A0AAV7UGB2_PLEWA|nr:hypothetical protein NDU88_003488 [Pleurodeles waltl]
MALCRCNVDSKDIILQALSNQALQILSGFLRIADLRACAGPTIGDSPQQYPGGTIWSGVGEPDVHLPPANAVTSAANTGVFKPTSYFSKGKNFGSDSTGRGIAVRSRAEDNCGSDSTGRQIPVRSGEDARMRGKLRATARHTFRRPGGGAGGSEGKQTSHALGRAWPRQGKNFRSDSTGRGIAMRSRAEENCSSDSTGRRIPVRSGEDARTRGKLRVTAQQPFRRPGGGTGGGKASRPTTLWGERGPARCGPITGRGKKKIGNRGREEGKPITGRQLFLFLFEWLRLLCWVKWSRNTLAV